MAKYLIAYLAAAITFFALDMLWLGILAKDFYRSALGDLLLDQPKLAIAAMFYAAYVVGLVIFAIAPAMEAGAWSKAAMSGVCSVFSLT